MNNKGGRGHKAPYKTTHIRVPENIKSAINNFSDAYKTHADETNCLNFDDETLKNIFISSLDSSAQNKSENVLATNFDADKIIQIAQGAFELKSNAGGKIKNALAEILEELGIEVSKVNRKWTVKNSEDSTKNL